MASPALKFRRALIVPVAAGLCLTALIVMAIFAPILAPHDPLAMLPAQRLKPPSELYPLGTDAYGRDLLSRIIYGARVSLIVGIGAALISHRHRPAARHPGRLLPHPRRRS